MTDLFEEVEEQLRSDRYRRFARKVMPWLLGAAAAALLATLGYWGFSSSTQGAHWRVRWKSPAGVAYEGPPIGAS